MTESASPKPSTDGSRESGSAIVNYPPARDTNEPAKPTSGRYGG
jgi:hypothetical protein